MPVKDAKKNERPSVGLALSGGAARGLAHVGVLRVLIEHGIPIDYIAGTSAGALVGGALAAGMSIDELEEIGLNLRWRDLGRPTLSRLGMQSNARLEAYVHARFPATRFEEMRIPFAAVATDLRAGSAVVMSGEGDIAFAIRASCAIPGWYVPVTDAKGRQLVDGGLVANVPTAAALSLGADVVIAVDVNSEGAKFLGPPQSAIGVMLQAMMVIQRTAAMHQWQDADAVIMPKVGHIRWDEIGRAADLIDAGRQAALANIERIKHLTQFAPKPPLKWYQFRRRSPAPQTEDKRRFSPLR
ncbi:MAG TPA: patatin-like phospholipase family protein [Pyrinomonadaceae bacterium]|jgi:NTE family protein|nr:patatin-like phospholipase family protein [Pyrinomonadaceae bacterium]